MKLKPNKSPGEHFKHQDIVASVCDSSGGWVEPRLYWTISTSCDAEEQLWSRNVGQTELWIIYHKKNMPGK